jgi:maltooligosyltrehalose trehalohydrolase
VNAGARPQPDGGVLFRLWAPEARSVALHLRRDGSAFASYQLSAANFQIPADGQQPEAGSRKLEAGCWQLLVADARPGDRYAYSIDGRDPLPDPASRFQPDGVHGWSEIVDSDLFSWTDLGWRGLDPYSAVIYELHVGTFTPEGTFAAAGAKLPYLRDLGVTAVELMPLADFAGCRNWGYDGVALFAPSRAYGRPDDLRAFVDAAHALHLGVLIDVVYNHLGPDGAYLPTFAPCFLTSAHQTPWGNAVNLDAPGSDGVRAFLIDNALHWIREYHADGLRLDATHALIDTSARPFVAELAEAVHAARVPRPIVYAEDSRNMSVMAQDSSRGGWNVDGLWADDFHHVVQRILGSDAHGYYADYEGTARELAVTLRDGWLYQGQHSRHGGAPRGTAADSVAMRKAIVCVENHDQVGNRALGDRPHQRAEPAAWRAAVTVLLTSAMTPLLFMGQEWSASSPFQFFTDFEPGLGQRVTDGRRDEFRGFPEFASPEGAKRIPDCQANSTFEGSRLRWAEHGQPEHARVLELHRALLRLRAGHDALQATDARTCDARALDADSVMVARPGLGQRFLIVARLRGAGCVEVDGLAGGPWTTMLTTEDPAFAPDPMPIGIDGTAVDFRRPGAVVLQRSEP